MKILEHFTEKHLGILTHTISPYLCNTFITDGNDRDIVSGDFKIDSS